MIIFNALKFWLQKGDFQTGKCSAVRPSVDVHGSQFVAGSNLGKRKRSITQNEMKYEVFSNIILM